jgi:hypothetical protein
MKITITTPAEIEEFLAAQCKLLREDRLPISVLLKPADDSCWRDGKQVSDAHGEAFAPFILGAMLSRASLKFRAEDRYPADSERSDREWMREQANEAGMLGGCDVYNEVMGWD